MFPAKAKKASLLLITAAGAATLTLHSFKPSLPTDSLLVSASLPDNVRAGQNAVVRSSRALFAITSTVVDYKYSLFGLSLDSDEYRSTLAKVHLHSAKKMLKLCEANKGFYVKAGQFVATMRQVPKEYSSTLTSLHDQAVPFPFKAIKDVLVTNLGQDLSDIFLSFDEQPIAAASIAQVHRAVLKDHQEVAIKVQYPGLEHQMKLDLATMSFLSKAVAWFFPEYRFGWLVSEFAAAIALELDFIQEARNSERTAINFKNSSTIRIPRVFWELTTSHVLTMEYCRGMKVDDLEFLKEMGINPNNVAKALVEMFAEMIFVHSFLHGDPHPGNILVSPEGPNGFCLVLLDHGLYKTLDEGFRLNYCQLWKAMILQDSNKIQQLSEHFGVGNYSKYLPVIFMGRTIESKSALGRGMSVEERKKLKQELKSLTMEDVSSFMESLPSEFLTVLRTDGLLRSLISKLGASQQVRLITYAKYAFEGLSPKLNVESDFSAKLVISRLKTSMHHLQLRLLLQVLEFLSWMEDARESVTRRLIRVLLSAKYVAGNLLSLLP